MEPVSWSLSHLATFWDGVRHRRAAPVSLSAGLSIWYAEARARNDGFWEETEAALLGRWPSLVIFPINHRYIGVVEGSASREMAVDRVGRKPECWPWFFSVVLGKRNNVFVFFTRQLLATMWSATSSPTAERWPPDLWIGWWCTNRGDPVHCEVINGILEASIGKKKVCYGSCVFRFQALTYLWPRSTNWEPIYWIDRTRSH